jgi:hypothetical protein
MQFGPWSREDCLDYVKSISSEIPKLQDNPRLYAFIVERLHTCRDPEGNMLRMLNEARGADGSWNDRHHPDRDPVIPRHMLSSACLRCGKPLDARRSTARFCSVTCRVAAHRLMVAA